MWGEEYKLFSSSLRSSPTPLLPRPS
jgi:hypothetical protein